MAEAVHDAERLKELQALPLDRKIQISQARIIEWYQRNKGNVVVSFSGGKDSTVLLHLVRSIYPDVPAVFSNTGLEYPEIQRFVRTFPNVTIVAPKMNFSEVISTYGYPLIGKEVAGAIYYARRIRSQSVQVEREREREREQGPHNALETCGTSRLPENSGGYCKPHRDERSRQQTDNPARQVGAETSRQRKTLHGLRSRNTPETERPHGPTADSGTSSGSNWGGGRTSNGKRSSTSNNGTTTNRGRGTDTNWTGSGDDEPG